MHIFLIEIKKLLSLDTSNLKELKELILDYNQLYLKSSFEQKDFIDYVTKKLNSTKPKISLIWGNSMFKEIFRKHQIILQKLQDLEILNVTLSFVHIASSPICTIQLIEELIQIVEEHERKVFLEKLGKLEELGIQYMKYNPQENLDGTYEICTKHMKENREECEGSVYWSDGEKTWLNQVCENRYVYEVKNANYVLKWEKGDPTFLMPSIIKKVTIKSLFFDSKTLPKKEEFKQGIPNIDYEAVKEKTRAVDQVYALGKAINSVNFLTQIKDILNQLPIDKNSAAYVESSLILSQMENLLDDL